MAEPAAAQRHRGALQRHRAAFLGRLARGRRGLALRAHHVALLAILALSVVLGTVRLSQNAWANTFYSAAALSMLRSWHNFVFVSFDPGGLITIDKPPLALWVQTASAWLFGLSPLSLLAPEALMGTATVALMYRMLARRIGPAAGLAGAAALAVFPSFVAVSRDNGVDPLLILFMTAACAAALNSIEDGRWRWLLASAVFVGLAFNTKTLAAYLVVPGIAAGYAVCAPGSPVRRVGRLALAGALAGVVSFSWIALVELTPAHSRPFVGSSTDNTELGLTFHYNGFGRVEGQLGGPGQIPTAPGGVVPARPVKARTQGRRVRARSAAGTGGAAIRAHARPGPTLPNGRNRNPIPFGEPPGPLRLFGPGLGDQGGWLLPLALAGLLALALALAPRPHGGKPDRRDPRLALLLVLGGWFAVEAAILSSSKGIVHPYYVSALAPGAAAMVGVGAALLADFARSGDWRALLLPCAVTGTVVAQLVLLHQQHYMRWFGPLLVALAALGVGLATVRRLAAPAVGLVLVVLLVAPAAFAATTWLAPVYGTFPAAGPHEASGSGLYGVSPREDRIDRALVSWVSAHEPTRRFALLAEASPTAAPLILQGLDAAAVGGYGALDPAVDGPRLARMLARSEARYVLIGGAYASRGGNLMTKAVLRDCPQVPYRAWHGDPPGPHTLVLFDCAGRERALEREPRY